MEVLELKTSIEIINLENREEESTIERSHNRRESGLRSQKHQAKQK
jgi:hypothetical protein